MNAFDADIVHFLNAYSHRSELLDAFIGFVADEPLIKAGFLTSALWLGWFSPDPGRIRRRELVISTLAATVAALILTKLLRSALPFRLRPLHDVTLGIIAPTQVATDTLWNWSSFPSDTAAMVCALAGGLFIMCPRWGWLALIYSLVVVCFPRVYLGYHYPSDIIVGGAIGLSMAAITSHRSVRTPLARPFLAWSVCYPGAFYGALFVFTYEVGSAFENVRKIITACFKAVSKL